MTADMPYREFAPKRWAKLHRANHLRVARCLPKLRFGTPTQKIRPWRRSENLAVQSRRVVRARAKASRCVPTSPVALGRYLAARLYGWTGEQWSSLYALWNRESGWDPYKLNYAGSGACGIPQFLPCRHYGDARAQIVAGLAYIEDRYETPVAADYFQRVNGWY